MEKEKKSQDKDTKKKNLLDDTLKQIEKQFGKGSIMKLGDRASVEIDAISSGSIKVDEALGIGGYPKGRIVEIYGPESSGKTTLALPLRRYRKRADAQPLSMRKMPLIPPTPRILVSISMI